MIQNGLTLAGELSQFASFEGVQESVKRQGAERLGEPFVQLTDSHVIHCHRSVGRSAEAHLTYGSGPPGRIVGGAIVRPPRDTTTSRS